VDPTTDQDRGSGPGDPSGIDAPVHRPIALLLFIARISLYFCMSPLNSCPSSHQILATLLTVAAVIHCRTGLHSLDVILAQGRSVVTWCRVVSYLLTTTLPAHVGRLELIVYRTGNISSQTTTSINAPRALRLVNRPSRHTYCIDARTRAGKKLRFGENFAFFKI